MNGMQKKMNGLKMKEEKNILDAYNKGRLKTRSPSKKELNEIKAGKLLSLRRGMYTFAKRYQKTKI